MGRERRSASRSAVAVFIAGGALLGLEIASSRVLAPFFGNSLYVWGALIGVVLAGPLDRLLARRLDRRPAIRRRALLVGVLGVGGLLVLAIPFVDGWVLDRVVAWDPGPAAEPAPSRRSSSSASERRARHASRRSPSGCWRARSRTSAARPGRLFAISTAGSIAGTFATAFWLIPELGTDQLLASPRSRSARGRRRSRSSSGWLLAFALALALAGASVAAVVSLAPDPGDTVAASQLRNWSPVYRAQRDRDADRRARGRPVGLHVVHAKDSQYHRLAVVEDDDEPLPALRQLLPERHVPRTTRSRRASGTPTTSSSRSPTGPRRSACSSSVSAAAPRRSGRGATSPALQIDVVELDPDVVDVAYRYFELPRDPRLSVEVEDGRRFLAAQRRALGRDRHRRLLLRLDPVPPRDAGVPRARAVAPRAREASSSRTSSARSAAPDSRLFRSMLPHLPRGLPDRLDPSGARRRRQRPRGDPEHHPRRRRRRRAVEGVPARALGASSARRSPGAPDLTRRSATGSTRPSRPTDVRC